MPILRAATAYWALVFAAGFVLGTVRTLWLAPAVGPLAAVAIELPIMLVLSWLAARMVLRRWPPVSQGAALATGALAFALLLGAELALALALGGTARGWLASLASAPGLLGLAGQAAFALLPWWLWSRSAPGPRLP